MDKIWTADRVEQLKRLHADGLSGRGIAVEFDCGISRNAVISKLHRLNLPQPASKKSPKGLHKNKPAQRRNPSHNILAKIATIPSDPGVAERLEGDAPDGTGIKLIELTEFTCRFPRGDPRKADFEFCGAFPVLGTPYCAHCAQIVYQPPYCRDRADQALAE